MTPRLPLVFALATAALVTLVVGADEPRDLKATVAWVEHRHPTVPQRDANTLTRQSVLWVDVRTAAEWAVGHLPEAQRIEAATGLVALAARHPDHLIVVYCSVGERSSRVAAEALAQQPDLAIANLRGGIFSWVVAELPVVAANGTAVTRVHPYDAHWGRLLSEHHRSDRGP